MFVESNLLIDQTLSSGTTGTRRLKLHRSSTPISKNFVSLGQILW